MATNIRIQVDDKQLRQALRIAPNRIINAMHKSLTNTAIETQNNFKIEIRKNGSINTGRLWQKIPYVFHNKLSVTVGPSMPYAIFVEKGTKPHWTSVREGTSLRDWADKKKINPYALQRSIARKGTKAHPFEKKVADKTVRFAQRDMQHQLDKTIKEIL